MYSLIFDHSISTINSLITAGAVINIFDLKSVSPIFLAGAKGNHKAMMLFFKKGGHIDPDAQDENGWTGLHHSVYGANPKCIKIMLAEGSDKSIRDKKGRRALDLARYHDYGDCCALLEDLKSRIAFATGEDFEG
jgi:ankyrin repeat protein